ncbi:hypothetical protein KA082_00675 [Candidatus Woesebacteria bacterium]|nr:hypothetical protein [Candidatus Woesebacteria bacterium]
MAGEQGPSPKEQMEAGRAAQNLGDTTTPSETPGAAKEPLKKDNSPGWAETLFGRNAPKATDIKAQQIRNTMEEEVLGKLAASRKVRYLPGSEGTADYYLTPTDTTNTENLIKVNATSRTNPEGKNK